VDIGFEPSHVAVIQTAFLGDVVFTSPLVRALTLAWPRARVRFVCRPKAVPLARCIPGVAEAVGYDKDGAHRGPAGLWRAARALRGVEVAVVPHPSLRSALLARLSGARVRVGPAYRAVRALYTVPVPPRDREPFVERWLDLARALGFDAPNELRLTAPPQAVEEAARLLGDGPCVGLVVGSEWAPKRWPPEHFAALADRLAAEGLRPVLLGAPDERPLAEGVLRSLRAARPLDLVGNGIVESLGVIARLRAAVGGDTGLLHVARALGTPALLLFGPTDPGAHTLEPHAQALRLGLPCQPCHAHGQRACPLQHHDCLRKLEVDRVWGALKGLLPRGSAA
jgi:heptosyltransferase II